MESHTGFQLLPKVVTLNDLVKMNSLMAAVLRYFAEFGSFMSHYYFTVKLKVHTVCDKNVAKESSFRQSFSLW